MNKVRKRALRPPFFSISSMLLILQKIFLLYMSKEILHLQRNPLIFFTKFRVCLSTYNIVTEDCIRHKTVPILNWRNRPQWEIGCKSAQKLLYLSCCLALQIHFTKSKPTLTVWRSEFGSPYIISCRLIFWNGFFI